VQKNNNNNKNGRVGDLPSVEGSDMRME